jgi:hypothetical protein
MKETVEIVADTIEQKRRGGAPPQNVNARKHGLMQARRVLSEFGLRAIDGRSAVGVALRSLRGMFPPPHPSGTW